LLRLKFGSLQKQPRCKRSVTRRILMVHDQNVSQYFRAFTPKGIPPKFSEFPNKQHNSLSVPGTNTPKLHKKGLRAFMWIFANLNSN